MHKDELAALAERQNGGPLPKPQPFHASRRYGFFDRAQADKGNGHD